MRPARLLDIHLLQELKGVVGMLRDPHNIQNIYDIEDGLIDTQATRLSCAYMHTLTGMPELITQRYLRDGPYDMDALRRLPPGTLGFELAAHIDAYGFDPNYYKPLPVTDDTTYLLMRIRETHDIWHVITGFHPTPIGEVGIKAVELAQLRRPMAAVICCGGVMRYMLRTPDRLGDLLAAISEGYHLGRHARPLLAQRWEDRFAEPVAALREALGVRVPGEVASGIHDPDGVQPSRPHG